MGYVKAYQNITYLIVRVNENCKNRDDDHDGGDRYTLKTSASNPAELYIDRYEYYNTQALNVLRISELITDWEVNTTSLI